MRNNFCKAAALLYRSDNSGTDGRKKNRTRLSETHTFLVYVRNLKTRTGGGGKYILYETGKKSVFFSL